MIYESPVSRSRTHLLTKKFDVVTNPEREYDRRNARRKSPKLLLRQALLYFGADQAATERQCGNRKRWGCFFGSPTRYNTQNPTDRM